MHIDPKEMVIIYNQNNLKDKQTLAFAQTITQKINKQDLSSVRVSSTLFELMLTRLGLEGKGVMNKALPLYQRQMRGKEFTLEEWFGILTRHPELLRAPIAMYKGKVVLCNTPTDILKLN